MTKSPAESVDAINGNSNVRGREPAANDRNSATTALMKQNIRADEAKYGQNEQGVTVRNAPRKDVNVRKKLVKRS